MVIATSSPSAAVSPPAGSWSVTSQPVASRLLSKLGSSLASDSVAVSPASSTLETASALSSPVTSGTSIAALSLDAGSPDGSAVPQADTANATPRSTMITVNGRLTAGEATPRWRATARRRAGVEALAPGYATVMRIIAIAAVLAALGFLSLPGRADAAQGCTTAAA